jgi:hypothetical protein
MMRLIKVDTTAQLADVFSKAPPYPQFIAYVRGSTLYVRVCANSVRRR